MNEPVVPNSTPTVPGTTPAVPPTEPTKPDAPAANFDTAKISDADFAKVLEDPRLWQHSRIAGLTEAQKKLKEIESNKTKEEEDRLKKQGEYQKLAEQKEAEANTLREELQQNRIDNKLTLEASKLGVIDIDALLKLVDRTKITFDANGTLTGVEDALKTLQESKAYLFGKGTTNRVGSPSNPGNQNTGELKRFKMSELQNPEFYRANEKDILASINAGLVDANA
jgi:hypothetical protein